MATVYSLICWGGSTGKTVTFTDAGYLVNNTNHGARDAKPVVFTDNGDILPTGLVFGTIYYTKTSGYNAFEIYTSAALTTQVTFTGTGSGTHICKSGYYVGLSDTSRWSSRIYDGLASWSTARQSAANATDIEVAEIGEAFREFIINTSTPTNPARAVVTTSIAGVRTAAFHGGDLSAGYELAFYSTTTQTLLTLAGYDTEIDGIRLDASRNSSASGKLCLLNRAGSNLKNSILSGYSASATIGLLTGGTVQKLEAQNNLIYKCATGVSLGNYANGFKFAHNIVTKCGTGITGGATQANGYFYNNISVGNTTDWVTQPSSIEGASHNAGSGLSAWNTAGGTQVSMATSDFSDFANNDFRPATATSVQIDVAAAFFGQILTDITDSVRPSYENGSDTGIDIGCFEFDHGFGPWPETTTVTFSGVPAGSEIRVYDSGSNALAGVEECTANPELTWAIPSPVLVRIVIIHPLYMIREFSYESVAGIQSIPIQQELDRWYSNP